jgi:uncharacterized repeat protein (TIGR03803 family)
MNPKTINSTYSRRLWGVLAAGVLMAAVGRGQSYEVVHSFNSMDVADPHTGLIQLRDGTFAGTTVQGDGSLFRMDAFGRLNATHMFDGLDGAGPHGPLIQSDLMANGVLFGTTMNGANGAGTVFKIDGSGAFTTCFAFRPSPGPGAGEGGAPHAGLMQASDGYFYGVTLEGGGDGYGTVFRMNASCAVTTVHHFSGFDGAAPYEALVEVGGRLYGTTSSGGTGGKGTVFVIDMNALHNFQTIHNFVGYDGASPKSPLINASEFLYGTTCAGGNSGLGTLYRINVSGTRSGPGFEVIHHFGGFDGANPHAGLLLARYNHLYGMTLSGGRAETYSYPGEVFRIHASGAGFEVVHRFGGMDGAFPQSRLIEATDGALYGTTGEGGSDNLGVVFRLIFVPVTAIEPSSGPATGTAVTLSGGNFQWGAGLRIGGADALNVLITGDSLITAGTPVLAPGTLNDVLVDNPDNTRGGVLKGFFADFLDVPQADIFHGYVEKIFRNGITVGVGAGSYGRNAPATRAQMAVFLLKGKHGQFYAPPPASGTVFADVPADDPFAAWIEQLHAEGITAGCDAGYLYCPYDPMTREQMAVALLKAEHGSGFTPPSCQATFLDVPCTAPYARWVEQLYREGVTAGCENNGGILFFCPDAPSTRGQTAVFLTKAFGLQ